MRVTLFICLCHPLLRSPSLAFSSVLIFIPTILPLALSILLLLLLLLFSFTLLSCFFGSSVFCCVLFLSSSSSFSRSLLFYNLCCLSSTSSVIAVLLIVFLSPSPFTLLHSQLLLLPTTHLVSSHSSLYTAQLSPPV